MANDNTIQDGFVRDKRGVAVDFAPGVSNVNKDLPMYAVVVQCGHCGNGYFIPMIFTTFARDAESAISEILKTVPRVKRDNDRCVLAVYKVNALEKFFIDSIEKHDEYIRTTKKGVIFEDRRIMYPDFAQRMFKYGHQVKLAEDYDRKYVLERFFAPRIAGSKLYYPVNVNKDELLKEYFTVSTERYGVEKGDSFFPMLYFLRYGPENDLGIMFENDTVMYTDKKTGGTFVLKIPQNQLKYLTKYYDPNMWKKPRSAITMDYVDSLPSSSKRGGVGSVGSDRVSRIDRFNKRWGGVVETQPGEE